MDSGRPADEGLKFRLVDGRDGPDNQVNSQRIVESVTVVIPTLNEASSIGGLIHEIRSTGFDNILITDGYSIDGTTDIASDLGAKVVMQHGKGKAGALTTAFRIVSTPYLIVMDGDGSYDPADLNKFLPLVGTFDFVKGVRARNMNMSNLHKIGNNIITKTFDMFFGTSVGDVCSGMYMLKTSKVMTLHLEKHPMTVEQEIAAELAQDSAVITTVPINYRKRSGGVSKTKTWRQGFRDLLTNFDLARTYNPIMMFSAASTLALLPAICVLGYAAFLYVFESQYHGGLLQLGLVLLVLGSQGLTVATIAVILRRIERKLALVQHQRQGVV